MRDELLDWAEDRDVRVMVNPETKELGFWAAEYLTCSNFPKLTDYTDGPMTAYAVNYAFLAPEEYDIFSTWIIIQLVLQKMKIIFRFDVI